MIDAQRCNKNFGRDFLEEIDKTNPPFYQENYINQLRKQFFMNCLLAVFLKYL
jgi:hypothetical protein